MVRRELPTRSACGTQPNTRRHNLADEYFSPPSEVRMQIRAFKVLEARTGTKSQSDSQSPLESEWTDTVRVLRFFSSLDGGGEGQGVEEVADWGGSCLLAGRGGWGERGDPYP